MFWFNGHHHRLVKAERDGIQVWSLAESGQPVEQWVVELDLDTMEITYGGR
jgi:hypothetical protein